MHCVNFCVLEKPFAIWSWDIEAQARDFLSGIDHDFYYRTAHRLINDSELVLDPETDLTEEQIRGRKDVAALSRLLRHHGIETLVMLWGAFLQAPHAPHGYFLKCKTEDTRALAGLLLKDDAPKFLRTKGSSFSLELLIKGIHACTPYVSEEPYMRRLTEVARQMLESVTDKDHRDEYNGLKHGLRTRHGGFQFLVGLEASPGVPAQDENMAIVGASHDASWFQVVRPLTNATKAQSRVNFQVEDITVPWSLEKTLCDLQLLSIFIANTVSTLLIACGAPLSSVRFHRTPSDAEDWWKRYDELGHTGITRWSMLRHIDARELRLRTEKDVIATYRSGPESV